MLNIENLYIASLYKIKHLLFNSNLSIYLNSKIKKSNILPNKLPAYLVDSTYFKKIHFFD